MARRSGRSAGGLRDWSVTVREAREVQRELRERVIEEVPAGFAPRYAAGADVSIVRGRDRAWAALVVLDIDTLETVDEAVASMDVAFPYVPGLLSFRELPPLEQAWARLSIRPDLVVFDGHGYAHPRRFGLASHGGVLFGVPSIGCAKTPFIGEHGPLAQARGATAPIVDAGEVVGMALRTRAGVNPVYVSVGHRMELPAATSLVLRLAPRFRLPETTRRAHALVNRLRRESGAA